MLMALRLAALTGGIGTCTAMKRTQKRLQWDRHLQECVPAATATRREKATHPVQGPDDYFADGLIRVIHRVRARASLQLKGHEVCKPPGTANQVNECDAPPVPGPLWNVLLAEAHELMEPPFCVCSSSRNSGVLSVRRCSRSQGCSQGGAEVRNVKGLGQGSHSL